jgi:hypothetical protein
MSFKDNFARDEQEDMLEYDDGAFYYFSLALITFVVIPYTYYTLKTLFFGDSQLEIFKSNCKCTHCSALIEIKRRQISNSRFNRSTIFRVLVGSFIWYIWYLNFLKVSTMKPL